MYLISLHIFLPTLLDFGFKDLDALAEYNHSRFSFSYCQMSADNRITESTGLQMRTSVKTLDVEFPRTISTN